MIKLVVGNLMNKIVLLLIYAVSISLQANTYTLPPQDQAMIGQIRQITVGRDTTLSDQARFYNVGFNEIRLANEDIDPWLPANDSQIIIPTQHLLPDAPRKGIVLNVPEMRLYYFPRLRSSNNRPTVITHPISIGRGDWETPLGNTRIISKKFNPEWRPPESIRQEHLLDGDHLPKVVPPGPDNPLGKHALRLSLPGYLIHGTNKPYGIGMRVTHGCVRMYPEDIEAIFDQVKVNTLVKIIHQPYKFGWFLNTLYMEAHPLIQPDNSYKVDIPALYRAIAGFNAKLPNGQRINWEHAKQIAQDSTGIPTAVEIDTY